MNLQIQLKKASTTIHDITPAHSPKFRVQYLTLTDTHGNEFIIELFVPPNTDPLGAMTSSPSREWNRYEDQ